jgi:hypothetical protein
MSVNQALAERLLPVLSLCGFMLSGLCANVAF